MFLTDEGCLLRRADSGENHTLLVIFLRTNGLKFALSRKRSKPDPSTSIPDIFEYGEFTLRQSDPSKPAFLKEFSSNRRFPGIARHYGTLEAASALTRFVEKNLIHMEYFSDSWDLLESALASLATHHRPEITLLKALYLFSSKEGYAVRAQWLEQKSPAFRREVSQILKNPVDEVEASSSAVREAIQNLNHYFVESTDLLPLEW